MFFQTTSGLVLNLGIVEGFQVYEAFNVIYITSLDSKYLLESFEVKNDGGFCYLDKRRVVAITDKKRNYAKCVCDLIIQFISENIEKKKVLIKTKDILLFLESEIHNVEFSM